MWLVIPVDLPVHVRRILHLLSPPKEVYPPVAGGPWSDRSARTGRPWRVRALRAGRDSGCRLSVHNGGMQDPVFSGPVRLAGHAPVLGYGVPVPWIVRTVATGDRVAAPPKMREGGESVSYRKRKALHPKNARANHDEQGRSVIVTLCEGKMSVSTE